MKTNDIPLDISAPDLVSVLEANLFALGGLDAHLIYILNLTHK